ncbi:putative golgi-specific brefeldin A-resistance guanine nucleotide exchange factor 1 [Apostichopus japonicus]|uniref:Putative golgi-specific brefeldin A-resistance guanine nucleotide exchange factor 1 n=1 Tax=Stichopus japonicus TaxID=307972 RepID=A0A2G8JNR7_STIJA|nr:putative golgi-specific brefeldin A-resistance guanine nucleotide exchange factor 1 [Apostichopus japonicus]
MQRESHCQSKVARSPSRTAKRCRKHRRKSQRHRERRLPREHEETGAPDQRQGESQSTLEVPGEEETNEDQEMSDDPQERQVISVMTEQIIDESEVKAEDQSAGELIIESVSDGNEDAESGAEQSDIASQQDSEYYNTQGVRLWPPSAIRITRVRELFRFLISLVNPYDRHNNELMKHMGLSLLTVALETGSDHISASPSLLSLVKDDMCKNIFAVVPSDRLPIFASALRVCFLLFESMRTHLKLQLEMFLQKLMYLIASESTRISYEQREMAVDTLVQLWRIPSFVAELYINYDCDVYCSNLFEDLTKLLSKTCQIPEPIL